jgi:hypothetical protein
VCCRLIASNAADMETSHSANAVHPGGVIAM